MEYRKRMKYGKRAEYRKRRGCGPDPEYRMAQGLRAGYTVEAAGVMTLVLVTVMVLINQAFYIHGATVGAFVLHTKVERERHAIEQIQEEEITGEARGRGWELEITAPVFRPEKLLRMWSLTEGTE